MNFNKIMLSVTVALMSPLTLQANGPKPFETYQSVVTDNKLRTKLFNDFDAFTNYLIKLTEDKPFVVYEFLGNSGADYLERPVTFVPMFTDRVKKIQADAKKEFGPEVKIIYLLGGSVDGFGVGYEIIEGLKNKGELSAENTIVAGLVSDDIVQFHMESIKQGWGNVISPYQDALFLMSTYKAPNEKKRWELIDTEGGPSYTITILERLLKNDKCKKVVMELFEGSVQALREGTEYIARIVNEPRANLELWIGFDPKNPAKDQGYRAASNIAYAIMKGVIQPYIDVRITSYDRNKREYEDITYLEKRISPNKVTNTEQTVDDVIQLITSHFNTHKQSKKRSWWQFW